MSTTPKSGADEPEPSQLEPTQPGAAEQAAVETTQDRRVLPFLMLTLPFTSLLIVGLVVAFFSSKFGALGAATAQERAERELFAIRNTPAAQANLLRTANEQPPTEWDAGVVWAVRDLAERSKFDLPESDSIGEWPSETRAKLSELLVRFGEELEADRVGVPGLYNRKSGEVE